MGIWGNLNMIRQEYSRENLTERIAMYTIDELKKHNYDCELVKPTKNSKTWRVLPKNYKQMKKDEMEVFEKVKKQTVNEFKEQEKDTLKELRKSLTGI